MSRPPCTDAAHESPRAHGPRTGDHALLPEAARVFRSRHGDPTRWTAEEWTAFLSLGGAR
ncbi:hypothetical protein ACIP88_26405 [Streptomyces uncialis]|uniref:hypothetical protein n=1 Tax=Streptomyces uncialis TaxID=1048205 RepID=UPI003814FF18